MKQIRLFPRYLGSLLLRVLLCILIGTLLLSAVCMMPSAPMDRNLERSAPVLEAEGVYPELFSWCTSQLDSSTDSLILMISAYQSDENPVIQAMSGTRNITTDENDDDLISHYGKGLPFDGTMPYYQYWHGYQLLISPALSVLDYSGIRILNGFLQTGLLIFLCILMYRRGLKRYILPYLAAVAMLMPVALAMSLQFSSCYYILTLSSIFLLWKKDHLDRLDGLLFLYIGIATAYFDFLTYPIATLGIPAVFYFCVRTDTDLRRTFCRGVKICFSWAVGYIGMWAGKWLIGSLILRQNILSVAGEKVAERSSSNTSLIRNIHAALSANIRSFIHTPATLAAVSLAVLFLILLIRKLAGKHIRPGRVCSTVFPFVILALLPIIWYLGTSQHAVIHYWFTNKALVVSVFAGLSALVKASDASQ